MNDARSVLQGPFYFSSVVGGILFLLLTLFPITKKANHDSHIKMATNIEENLLPQESDWRLLVLNSVKVLSLIAGSIITYFCIKVVSDWTGTSPSASSALVDLTSF